MWWEQRHHILCRKKTTMRILDKEEDKEGTWWNQHEKWESLLWKQRGVFLKIWGRQFNPRLIRVWFCIGNSTNWFCRRTDSKLEEFTSGWIVIHAQQRFKVWIQNRNLMEWLNPKRRSRFPETGVTRLSWNRTTGRGMISCNVNPWLCRFPIRGSQGFASGV